ncbi:MAG TPA: hypothetical protein VFL56_05260 [Solirubrobacterales bacterium]|nr:hypothetical protein [Solirubrobacterales bacterium]
MANWDDPPRSRDEWRVEVLLDEEHQGDSLSERLHNLQLDNEARRRLGGSVIVTRDGRSLFIYAWHEESAREAERVIRDLMEQDGLVGQIRLVRWHPIAEEWKDAEEPLPENEAAVAEEMRAHDEDARRDRRRYGDYSWEVVIDLPSLRDTLAVARKLEEEDLAVKRRFRYLLIGAETEEGAIELGKRLEGEMPAGSHVGIRGNPEDMPPPTFVHLGSLKPGFLRDLGL